MSQTDIRLLNCFEAVFPELPPDDVPTAAIASMPEWDSLATVTLMSLIEEEFSITISTDDLELFISFPIISELIGEKLAAA
jgi:acyl carrier protein